MSERHPIDRTLLTGYIDGVLTQGDRQRVSVHLESCAECRQTVAEMRTIRDVARSTPFRALTDDQWNEAPRSSLSRWARNAGWALLALWLVATIVLVSVLPGQDLDPLLGRVMIWGAVAGWLGLFASAAMDRYATSRTDVYRGVKK
ncbi:MAG TPA: zf-HC2 domain-containing protein [Thermoanaerobaculia bacterium]|nr:zf-HC2 domain-containing protein [Thermoanaerobaculia bacterium]